MKIQITNMIDKSTRTLRTHKALSLWLSQWEDTTIRIKLEYGSPFTGGWLELIKHFKIYRHLIFSPSTTEVFAIDQR
jgi:hypothetical protein